MNDFATLNSETIDDVQRSWYEGLVSPISGRPCFGKVDSEADVRSRHLIGLVEYPYGPFGTNIPEPKQRYESKGRCKPSKGKPLRARTNGIAAVLVLTVNIGCFGAVEIVRHRKTTMRLIEIGKTLDACKALRGGYPPSAETELRRLSDDLFPCGAEHVESVDYWGNSLRYVSDGAHFALWSQGRNSRPDISMTGGTVHDVDTDIVLSDRGLWQCMIGLGSPPIANQATQNPFVELGALLGENTHAALGASSSRSKAISD